MSSAPTIKSKLIAAASQEADRVAARIEQDDLRGAERFRAEVEKKRQPKMRKLEKEQEARGRDG